jgi:hypothetical protein
MVRPDSLVRLWLALTAADWRCRLEFDRSATAHESVQPNAVQKESMTKLHLYSIVEPGPHRAASLELEHLETAALLV